MKPYRIEQGAEADFAEALEFYREESEALAGRLYDEIHRLIAEVCAAPRLYRVVAAPVRRPFSETFPYAVLYVESPITSSSWPSPTSSAIPATGASGCAEIGFRWRRKTRRLTTVPAALDLPSLAASPRH